MLCQNCGKHEATTHIKRVVNGETTQAHLCAHCASQLGYGDVFSDFGFNFGDFFGGFFSQPAMPAVGTSKAERCPMCGASFQEIVKSGKIGCAECYDKFYDLLLPSVQRIHGKTAHSGKIAANNEIEIKKEDVIEELKTKLSQAIEEQNFEYAAELRDKIKEMESGEHHE